MKKGILTTVSYTDQEIEPGITINVGSWDEAVTKFREWSRGDPRIDQNGVGHNTWQMISTHEGISYFGQFVPDPE